MFAILLLSALLASAGVFPYALQVSGASLAEVQFSVALIWAASTLQATLLAGLAALVGLRLAPSVGLGAPLIADLVHGRRLSEGHLGRAVGAAVLIGAAVGGLILVLDVTIFATALEGAADEIARPAPVWGLLASFYGGIVEELLLRFGLMTLLVWMLHRVFGRGEVSPGHVWSGNALAALGFGLGHLPLTAAAVPLTVSLVVRAQLLNGDPGIVFGLLYWRRGLVAVMVAHFGADVVLHVLFPLVTA